jgi:hypothetical protein
MGEQPIAMALAINVSIPWTATNERHRFIARLLTEDGQSVADPEGKALEIQGDFEMGRPPGTKPGTAFNAPMAVQLVVPLALGGYRWELSIDGTVMAEESFTVVAGHPGGLPG